MGELSWTRVYRRDFAKTVARVVVASHAVVCVAMGEVAGTDPPSDGAEPFRYERMSSERLARAIKQCPVAWISAGIVEWHGEQNACGLDGLKAETLCQMAAQLLGGVCFPHVWLGPDASTPFDPAKYPRGTLTIDKPLYLNIARDLLSQIEAMGFQVVVWLSGHYPGVIPDVAKEYNRRGKLKVLSLSEHHVVKDLPAGDHAAAWETSLLMALRPGLVDVSRLPPLPTGVKPAGEAIPPQWLFRQRCEYYGLYGADPRVWANATYGRRGVELIIDGLAREVGRLLNDSAYGKHRPAITWPADERRPPEMRYAYLLPYQWMEQFSRSPVVYVPLPAGREDSARMVEGAGNLARRSGGMVFPPVNYGPSKDQQGVHMSRKLYLQAVGQIVQALSDMGFRVIALAPSSSVSDEVLNDLRQLRVGHDQAEVRVVDPPKPESSVGPIEEACRRLIPRDTRTRRLDGEWRVNSEWRIASLSEGDRKSVV